MGVATRGQSVWQAKRFRPNPWPNRAIEPIVLPPAQAQQLRVGA